MSEAGTGQGRGYIPYFLMWPWNETRKTPCAGPVAGNMVNAHLSAITGIPFMLSDTAVGDGENAWAPCVVYHPNGARIFVAVAFSGTAPDTWHRDPKQLRALDDLADARGWPARVEGVLMTGDLPPRPDPCSVATVFAGDGDGGGEFDGERGA